LGRRIDLLSMFSAKTTGTRFLPAKYGWMALILVSAFGASALALYRWLQTRMDVVAIQVNGVPLTVEVANNHFLRTKGLKKRTMLVPEAGMLFVFPKSKKLQFWMKDTSIDLDIGFFDSQGRLLNTTTMTAFDDTTQHTSSGPAKYALEVNRGWFAAHGLSEDAFLVLPSKLDTR
jgi:uncharacterized membrane protein (UPF0127 family)